MQDLQHIMAHQKYLIKLDQSLIFLILMAFSKYLGEEAIKHLSKGKIEFNILRLFNVFGPGQPYSGPYALVLGIFLNQV